MRLKILSLLTLITLFSLPLLANAATYNWYFANAGNDTTGNGTEANPWKTATKARNMIHATSSDDVVNVYWNRGDTFDVSYSAIGAHGFVLKPSRAQVTMDAYGTGAKPILDGGIDWPNTFLKPANINYSTVHIDRDDCTFRNLRFQNIYMIVFLVENTENDHQETGLDNLLIEDCVATNLGFGFVDAGYLYTTSSNVTVRRCEVSYANYRQKNDICSWCWRAAISNGGTSGEIINMTVDSCYVHDSYGEGITIGTTGTISNCLVVNTAAPAIYISPQYRKIDGQVKVTNNLIAQGTGEWSRGSGHSDMAADGIVIRDESIYGNNNNATVNICGNIVIGARRGIGLDCMKDDMDSTQIFESVNVYNNILIDNTWNFLYYAWYRFNGSYTRFADNIMIINNSSILYTPSGLKHVATWGDAVYSGTWTLGPNHWYTKGSKTPTVDSYWTDNWGNHDGRGTDQKGDPKLIDTGWRSISDASDFEFSDFYPPSDSGLVDVGYALSGSYNHKFLTTGTNWHDLPNKSTFVTVSQNDQGAKWDMGATVHDFNAGGTTFIQEPKNVGIKPK